MIRLKNNSIVSVDRITNAQRFSTNPMDTMTPQSLKRALNAFEAGQLQHACMFWDVMQKADDACVIASGKRKASVARHKWKITLDDQDDPIAQKHAETLEDFFNSLRVTDATKRDRTGGVTLLVKQMMDAVCKGFAVHEIVWQRRKYGQPLQAELVFVPLKFFEHTTGRLRYIHENGSKQDLLPGEWITHVADGLMYAASICIMFKRFSLQDWMVYSERFGADIPHGSTDADPGTPQWEATLAALVNLAAGQPCLHGTGVTIDTIKPGAAGQMPFPKIDERMNRAIHAMFRGADLATQSSTGTGASVQADEVDILEDDDAAAISDSLAALCRVVIQHSHGDETPRAKFELCANVKEDTQQELNTDKALDEMGYKQKAADLGKRYGRELEAKDEGEGMEPETGNLKPEKKVAMVNERAEDEAASLLVQHALENDLLPFANSIQALIDDTGTPLGPAVRDYLENGFWDQAETMLLDDGTATTFQELYSTTMKGTS